MNPEANLVQNLANSHEHTVWMSTIQAVGLDKILQGDGPFTVFVPKNSAFTHLPATQWAKWLQPQEQTSLKELLSYHVIEGRWTTSVLREAFEKEGGMATLTTLDGSELYVLPGPGGTLLVQDSYGDQADVLLVDSIQKNGVVFVINRVLIPPHLASAR